MSEFEERLKGEFREMYREEKKKAHHFLNGLLFGAVITLLVGATFATLEMKVNETRIKPIVVQCPDNSKQIIIPKMDKWSL